MITFLTVLHILVCLFLILVVLLQAGKGGGMGIAFGGGGSQTVFGSSGAGNFLTRLTSITATVFLVTSLGLAHYSSQQDSKRLQRLAEQKQVEKKSDDERAAKLKEELEKARQSAQKPSAPPVQGVTTTPPAEAPAAPVAPAAKTGVGEARARDARDGEARDGEGLRQDGRRQGGDRRREARCRPQEEAGHCRARRNVREAGRACAPAGLAVGSGAPATRRRHGGLIDLARLPFTKVEGLGNDFVVVDLRQSAAGEPSNDATSVQDPAIVRAVCDRHFGVGADGVLAILPAAASDGDARMRVLNADGSEAEMCGNGLRCVAKVLYDSDPSMRRPVLRIDTGAGLLACAIDAVDGQARTVAVEMGRPRLTRDEIPMHPGGAVRAVREAISARGRRFKMTAVSMGNPHAVIFVDDADQRSARPRRGVRADAGGRPDLPAPHERRVRAHPHRRRTAPRSTSWSGSGAAASRSRAAPARARRSPPPASRSACTRASRRRCTCRAARSTSPSPRISPASACAGRR